MICPVCKANLAGGDISTCSVCGAGIEGRDGNTADSGESLVEVFRTPDPALFMVVKSALQSAGFHFEAQGEEGLHVFPLSLAGGFFNAAAYGASIHVRAGDYEDARRLLEDAGKNVFERDTQDS